MPIDPSIQSALKVLQGYADLRETRLKKRGLLFTHYTSAEVAAQILLKRNVWMRNAASMNDYLEITFGSQCLKAALAQYGQRLATALDQIHSGVLGEVLDWLGQADLNHHQHTFLTCLSEHRPNDDLGLLSMWRAYGGPVAGVALIFNNHFLDIDSADLAAWSSPVLYGDTAYITQFEATVTRIEQNLEILKELSSDMLKRLMFNALQFSILSAKHVGFREEREWRIIHGPYEFSSAWVQPTFESIRGKPEVVYHLPLENLEGMSIPEIDLKSLLNRVIIGPCQNPYQMASTFAEILRSLGFDDPVRYLRVSNIPLRQLG